MYMLDTDICVYVLEANNEALEATLAGHAREICISAICHAELWYGVEHFVHADRNRAGLEHFLDRLDVQAFGPEAGRHYGDIREQLNRRGTPIGSNDLLIAAHARSMEATLVTNNVREFSRVPGLEVVNWV